MDNGTVLNLINVNIDENAAVRACDIGRPEQDVKDHAPVGSPRELNIVTVDYLRRNLYFDLHFTEDVRYLLNSFFNDLLRPAFK